MGVDGGIGLCPRGPGCGFVLGGGEEGRFRVGVGSRTSGRDGVLRVGRGRREVREYRLRVGS